MKNDKNGNFKVKGRDLDPWNLVIEALIIWI